ncbi:hypothetical protein [Phenylobacterium immobile]|uniref:hypothetical protein n=1 Tax=Phenylobacterium immobile TaxID=21 RepID=UPI000AD38BC3|nr:hypothetical protein [Phenylobacterium immobile]
MDKLIPLSDDAGWHAALHGLRYGFGHTLGACRALALSSGSPTFLYVFESNDAKLICPLSERSFAGARDICTPFGFSGFAGRGELSGFPQHWRDYARRAGWVCGYIGQHPLYAPSNLEWGAELFAQNELFFLDLKQSEEALYGRLSRSRRRQIAAWSAPNRSVVADRSAAIAFFTDTVDGFFAAKGAAGAYFFSPETWRALFELESVMVLGAQVDGRIVAATVFVYSPFGAEALFNVSVADGRDAATAIMWSAALALQRLGVASLNMGGGVRPGDPVAEAKRQFGAEVRPLNALKQIYDRDAFLDLSPGWIDRDMAGYFPPYHKA